MHACCLQKTPLPAQEASASLQSPAASLSLDRRDPKQAIASLAQGPPLLVDLGSGEMTPLPLIPAGAQIKNLYCVSGVQPPACMLKSSMYCDV
jgi:hypothetical protein